MKRILIATLLVALLVPALASSQDTKISSRLDSRMAADPTVEGQWGVWIYFTDKAVSGAELTAALRQAEQDLPERTLNRRAKVRQAGSLVDGTDLPVAAAYIDAARATGALLRKQSRWINAASFNATREQIADIAALPFVAKVDLVAQFIRPEVPVSDAERELAEKIRGEAKDAATWTLGYGASTATLEQINVPPLHDLGLTGDGVIIAMLDAGFRTLHPVFDNLDIVAQWDFVNDDPIVDEEEGDATFQARHGTQTLSMIAGFKEGEFGAPAFGASVILAMTEEVGDELPIEEDNWVAGLEWAESLGADIISTSLGYFFWYEFSDMDGNTAVTTVAGDMAVGRGLLVVTSAGNERDSEWGHMTAPADGDSIIAAGAVGLNGDLASFSSPGPTYDGRIKPDVSAQGLSNIAASYYDDVSYNAVDGTSFACPLIAGVGALLLERVPQLTPMQIREALRMTADRASTPDNDYGWGIIDALAAMEYWGPSVGHTPLTDTEDVVGPYAITAVITDRNALDPANMNLHWRVDGGTWTIIPLASLGGDTYGADIPGLSGGGAVDYYLRVGDTIGITVNAPLLAPDLNYSFNVGTDLIAPVVIHAGTVDQTLATWPPLLSATATDNLSVDRVELDFTVNAGGTQGPFLMTPVGNDIYSLEFPLTVGEISEGDVVDYTITAWDAAGTPNATINGPHEIRIVANLGSVLVINDSFVAAKDNGEKDSAADIGLWLTEAGYLVDHVVASDITPGYFEGYDALVLSCSNNPSPVDHDIMRDGLVDWAQDHGRILLEGGEMTAWIVGAWGGHLYPDFVRYVMHVDEYWGSPYFDWTILQTPGYTDHPFLNRPHLLPEQITMSGWDYDLNAVDYAYVAEDALPIYKTAANSNTGGVVLHDENTAPESGQIVYFTWDMDRMDPVIGRQLTENAMAYLMAREAPGSASIAGVVRNISGDPLAGVTVSSSTGESAVTGPDGAYVVTGLHGSYYNLTATLDGFGPDGRLVVIAEGEARTDVDFILQEVFLVQALSSPEVTIPDNNLAGVSDVITITEEGNLNDLTIDINIEHASIGHLTVVLTNPQGTSVTLHNRTGAISDDIIGNWDENLTVDGPGSLDDFVGQSVQGDWTLTVADHQFGAFGTFRVWQLNMLVAQPGISAAPENNLPLATRLVGNAPNPFNPKTVIAFDLAKAGHVDLEVFDVRGRLVKKLASADFEAGQHRISWQGRDEGGRGVASGVYFARLTTVEGMDLQKMMLVR